VSECLVSQALERGIPCAIYRPGTLTGDTVRGASNQEAFINRLLCGIVLMKVGTLNPFFNGRSGY
jgi:thioester reductase-like protein